MIFIVIIYGSILIGGIALLAVIIYFFKKYWRRVFLSRDLLVPFFISLIILPPLIGIIAWPFISLLSFMAFDAPGSDSSPFTVGLVLSILMYPLPTLAGAWFTYQDIKKRDFSHCFLTVFLTYCGLFAIIILIEAIKIFCGNSFACR